MTLGKRIQELRHTSGMTQQELAKITQTTLQHISSIEQDKRTPSLPLLIKITKQLNASLDYLVFGEESHTDVIAALKADNSLEDEAKKALIKLMTVMRKANKHQ